MARQPKSARRRAPRPPQRLELLEAIERAERGMVRMASDWHDSLPAAARFELLQLVHPLQRILVRSGRLP